MIVDSSALVALVRQEPAAGRVIGALAGADRVQIAAPVWFESCIVMMSDRIGLTLEQITALRGRLELELIDFDEPHAEAALKAWLRYGKGRHPAALNFADCMSYAAAQVSGSELLFVGADFGQTDIVSV